MKIRILTVSALVVLALSCGFAGYVTRQPETVYITEPEYVDRWQSEVVEKPVYIDRPVYVVVEKPVYITANITHETQVVSEELNNELLILMAEIKGKGFIPWKSKDDIRYWVDYTAIPLRQYIKDVYDCDNFAISLYLAGRLDGRNIGILWDYQGRHAQNFTVFGNYWIPIEPQTGNLGEPVRVDEGLMP